MTDYAGYCLPLVNVLRAREGCDRDDVGSVANLVCCIVNGNGVLSESVSGVLHGE
jgi:hypothetical protein